MRKKEEAKPKIPKSRYEEQWSFQDYKDNEPEFKQMAVEMKECLDHEHGSVVMARWLWLEKQGAVKLTAINGNFEPLARKDYSMMSAKYDRFTEWLAFREKKDPKYDEMLAEVLKSGRAKIGVISKKVDPEMASLEALAQTEIYNDPINLEN